MANTSKYDGIDLKQVADLAAAGLTERQLALELEVHQSTITQWKKSHPEFRDLLQTWKYEADKKVERSLYERATGYEHTEEKIFCSKDGEITRVETIKHIPPDVKACIFWLKNRQADKWRDKLDHEHSGKLDLANSILAARKRVGTDTEEEDIYA
jgi:transcriptional regulator with XRE-family HTH domain